MTADVIALQLAAVNAPLPSRTTTGTNLILPDVTVEERLTHFPEEVYDLRDTSHLKRLMVALLGDAGIGQSRKRLMLSRLQQAIQGIHFHDLDRFYGSVFGVRRTVNEMLSIDPYTQAATTGEWNVVHAKDASYRSRIVQFARAITYGATPTGMELVAEALLSVDCDIYESYIQADSSYQTHGEIEAQYTSYALMEGLTYGQLEGEGLARLAGDDRREFIVRPKRPITASEAYELTRVLDRLKPADARFTIAISGVASYLPTPIRGAVADSNYWEVVRTIAPLRVFSEIYAAVPIETQIPDTPSVDAAPLPSVVPVEQPRPPFSASQTQRWSYATDVAGISAYSTTNHVLSGNRVVFPDPLLVTPVQRRVQDATSVDFLPSNALASAYLSESINARLVAHPYWGSSPYTFPDLAPLYADGIPINTLTDALTGSVAPGFSQRSNDDENHYWASPLRMGDDATVEILDLRFGDPKIINTLSFDEAHFPHQTRVLAGADDGTWTVMASTVTMTTSRLGSTAVGFSQPGQPVWTAETPRFKSEMILLDEPVVTSRIRIEMVRLPDNSPVHLTHGVYEEIPFPLALRNLDLGYAVRSFGDVPDSGVIATSKDILGSRTDYVVRTERLADLISGSATQWKSEPQPVSYAVVSAYLDVRNGVDAVVIDRFYLEPTHPGPHLTVYYTNDDGEPGQVNTDWYNTAIWTPIPRDYTLQKGFLQIPPTRAKHFKFEFTSLTAEPYDSVLPIARTVRLFPAAVAAYVTQGTGAMSELPAGVAAAQEAPAPSYADAEPALRNIVVDDQIYAPTEVVHASDPAAAVALRRSSWALGFQPWHQGGPAPRFMQVGRHNYDTLEISHITKVGFSVGLLDVKAYRQDFGADDDTQVYLEQFHDFRHLAPGFTWTFNPNALTTETASNCSATSSVLASLHGVRALQFATQQTPAIQLVPDDDFRDPANAANTWSSLDGWHKVGDAILAYRPGAHSVAIARYAQVPEIPLSRPPGHLAEDPVHPVFSTRETTPIGPAPAPVVQVGGIETPLLGVASAGQVHAAIRLTIHTLTQPFYVEIVSGSTVLASKAITGAAGTVIEDFVSYRLQGETSVSARVVQYGPSYDEVELDTLSVFDEGIVWDFSVNGGTDWVTAYDIRNNANGILTFPEPGNQLVWRARGLRPHMSISAVKIRPLYVGVQDARYSGAQRGPNVSTYDQDVPVQDDPMFTDWHSPIPKGWFTAFKRFPSLPVEGAPNVTEYARYYGRPVGDTLGAPGDSAVSVVLHLRSGEERMDFFQPVTDGVARNGSVYRRTPGDGTDAPVDATNSLKLYANPGKPFNRVVHPT